MRDVMDNRRILIVNLSKGRLGEDNSTLLGSLIVSSLQQAAMSRVDIPEEQRQSFFLYCDEFQSFTTSSFQTILSEARKYRLAMTLAHQYLSQIEASLSSAVFGNVGTMIAFQVGIGDAEILAEQLSKYPGQVLPQDLANLPLFNAYVRLLHQGMPTNPFSMQTLKPLEGSEDRSAIVIASSRRQHARPMAKVQEELHAEFALA
jgi:hypothetical protein